ncbi:MAG: dihydrolipoyl dehydrogenase [Magnetococcus sp. WYHC-3]
MNPAAAAPCATPPWDLLVIGAGPGGYVAAIRAAQLGLRTACVERRATLGGVCLNAGCIPSKALLTSSALLAQSQDMLASHGVVLEAPLRLDLPAMMARKDRVVAELTQGIAQLFRKYHVSHLQGQAQLEAPGVVRVQSPDGTTQIHHARHVLLATGGQPLPPAVPGLVVDGVRMLDSRHALALTQVPTHLLVIGAGAIGLEMGSLWSRLGSRVTLVESLPDILPSWDPPLVRLARRSLTQQGLALLTGQQVLKAEARDTEVMLTLEDAQGQRREVQGSHLLWAAGRRPDPEAAGADALGLIRDPQGRVVVSERMETNLPGLYAVGDLTPGPMLAHRASEQGRALAEILAGHPPVPLPPIPSVIYTKPELACVGASEFQARAQGHDVRVGSFFFMANGRARTADQAEGVIRSVVDRREGRLLGVAMLGPHASELVLSATLALQSHLSVEDLVGVIAPHPTLGEALVESLRAAWGAPIHA